MTAPITLADEIICPADIVEGFAGPGGLSSAARDVGLPKKHVGFEIGRDACATAMAAGHPRVRADVRTIDTGRIAGLGGWISAPPCPSWSSAGKRTGRADVPILREAIESLVLSSYGLAPLNSYLEHAARVTDPRTALVLETFRIALHTEGLDWMVAEQVPAVYEIWTWMATELATAGWASCHILRLRADDFGGASRRERVFLLAHRTGDIDVSDVPHRGHWWCTRYDAPAEEPGNDLPPLASLTMATALGWPDGVMIRTRGNRKTSGGNLFPADRVAQGLTEKARSWKVEANPNVDLTAEQARELTAFLAERPTHALTPAEAGVLQGFPRTYPWQGSRSSQFLQIADTVNPLMGAAALGVATGTPWREAVMDRIHRIYPPAALSAGKAACSEMEMAS